MTVTEKLQVKSFLYIWLTPNFLPVDDASLVEADENEKKAAAKSKNEMKLERKNLLSKSIRQLK